MKSLPKKTVGAWLVHHSSKLQQISNVTSFDSIALAGKAGLLLSTLCESESQSTLSKEKVDTLARSAGISAVLELPTLLNKLESQRLISISNTGDIETLGLTTSAVLQHTHDIFISSNPQKEEFIAIDIAERTSQYPYQGNLLKEYISDTYQTTNLITDEIFSQSEEIGFIDHEDFENQKIYFNGNLFRTNDPKKMLSIRLM
ncbi:hypothetical protein [Herpetosiphon geysericola]|uniref:hypothetical protein n=1 Tax=Herpetosiphon geysericola TaxID=70996 RepID=UPI0006C929EC|nr:hypothetical protein [Herpetosiphon geysericola]